MSFKAHLKIGSKEFDVISCSYALQVKTPNQKMVNQISMQQM